jgi:hypothetical protein
MAGGQLGRLPRASARPAGRQHHLGQVRRQELVLAHPRRTREHRRQPAAPADRHLSCVQRAHVRSRDQQLGHLVAGRPHRGEARSSGARRLRGRRRRILRQRRAQGHAGHRALSLARDARQTSLVGPGLLHRRPSPPTTASPGRSTGATTSRAPARSRHPFRSRMRRSRPRPRPPPTTGSSSSAGGA